MLYDQAMALWVYSLAYSVIGNDDYKEMAEGIIKCLDDSFKSEGFFISAHDADTGHAEGKTYLWSFDELNEILNPEEFDEFSKSYSITRKGNFEGLNHLVRNDNRQLKEIESKLLTVRIKRQQPSPDNKIISRINALSCIALIQAGRLLNKPDLEYKAADLIDKILSVFWDGKNLGHSAFNGKIQKQPFLSDAAAVLTALTMLAESDEKWKPQVAVFASYVESFRENENWIESRSEDFKLVHASCFDHPFPSSVSLAEMGLSRAEIISGKDIPVREFRQPFQSDFYNITSMISKGQFHIRTTKSFIPYNLLPSNTIQVRGEEESDCYMGACRLI